MSILTSKSLGTTYTSTRIILNNGISLYATFDLSGAKTGVYDLSLIKPGIDTATLPQGFSIVPGSGGAIAGGKSGSGLICYVINGGVEPLTEFNVDVQSKVLVVTPFQTVVEFYNRGNVDVELPLVEIQSLDNAPVSYDELFSAILKGAANMTIEWVNDRSPKGILRPGARAYSVVFSALLGDYLIDELLGNFGFTPHALYHYQLIGK